MSETAARLSDQVIPDVNVRQWVLSLPIQLRYWLSSNPKLVTSLLEIIIRTLSRFQKNRAKLEGVSNGQTGAVTFIQRFGSALNMNVHFHMLILDGVFYKTEESEKPVFHTLNAPTAEEIKNLVSLLAYRITRHLHRKGYLKEADEPTGDGADPLSAESPLLASFVAASV